MKKIALTVLAITTLGLAACGDNKAESNTSNVAETVNEGLEDLGNAANALESEAANLGDTAENVADQAGNVVDQAGEAAENVTK